MEHSRLQMGENKPAAITSQDLVFVNGGISRRGEKCGGGRKSGPWRQGPALLFPRILFYLQGFPFAERSVQVV